MKIQQVSKNCVIDLENATNDIEEVFKMAKERRSFYVGRMGTIIPAAVVQNWQARYLHIWLKNNLLFPVINLRVK